MLPGCRSSDFFCRVHLLVAVSTTSIRSLAMFRGRGCLVIGLARVVGYDDRAFAPVGILDEGRRQMQRADYRLAAISPHLRQGAFQTFSGRAKMSERIIDADAPIRAGDD